MLTNALAMVKANKDKLIKIGLATIGAIAGVALVIVSRNQSGGEVIDGSGEPSAEPPAEPEA